jgi:hypothetical protein
MGDIERGPALAVASVAGRKLENSISIVTVVRLLERPHDRIGMR